MSSLENRHAARAALVKSDIIPLSRMIRPRYFSLAGETHVLPGETHTLPSTKGGYLLYLYEMIDVACCFRIILYKTREKIIYNARPLARLLSERPT